MEELSTQHSLIRFVYNDITFQEKEKIEREMSHNYLLRAEFEMLKEAKQLLPKVTFEPSSSVLDRILSYSKAITPEPYC
jgi:hypothetical protein